MPQRADYEISGLLKSDILQIAEIEKLSFSDPWSEQSLKEELTTPFSEYFVCRKDGKVLGYIGTRIIFDECDITNIAVHPDFRRCKIATVLFSELHRSLQSRNVKSVNLEVREGNAPARAFYGKCGFSQCGLRKNYYRNPDEDAILMTLILGE